MMGTETTVLSGTKLRFKFTCKTTMSYDSSSVAKKRGPLEAPRKKKKKLKMDCNVRFTDNLCGQMKKSTLSQNVSVTKSSENAGNGFGAKTKAATKVVKTVNNSTWKLLGKRFDNGGRQCSGSTSLVGSKCRSSLRTDYCFYSEICSESSLGKEQKHHLSSANVTEPHRSKSDRESPLDVENVCPNSQLRTPVPVTDAIFSVPLSPKKALRGAMLKSRFADILFKSQQKTLVDQGNTSDLLKMQQEKARLGRKQREEKARIEAELRVAEAAVQRQAELELKEQQEREREEARSALEKIERTVEFEQNCYLAELKNLSGYYGGSWGPHFRSPLERLGLFFKDEEYIIDYDELEEGEILGCSPPRTSILPKGTLFLTFTRHYRIVTH